MSGIPPHTWRAGVGYVPPEGSIPMFWNPAYYNYSGYPPIPPNWRWQSPPAQPVSLPPQLGPGPPPPYVPPPPTSAAPANGGARPGFNTMDVPTAKLHLFFGNAVPWELTQEEGQAMYFEAWLTPVYANVQEVLRKHGKDEEWALTEIFEEGDGKWARGMTIKWTDGDSGKRISEHGWTERRGTYLPHSLEEASRRLRAMTEIFDRDMWSQLLGLTFCNSITLLACICILHDVCGRMKGNVVYEEKDTVLLVSLTRSRMAVCGDRIQMPKGVWRKSKSTRTAPKERTDRTYEAVEKRKKSVGIAWALQPSLLLHNIGEEEG
ncbi:hypothetical protein M501DRAFT_989377 [Patellaria atrata CBS 101060]|uniref:Uncharacterized protein n=1 Tax=Patellaria atrata CBS 101060 TaxID=1346257 RepID=A0A9P4S3H9_9PEZI|nr:hypothetical protein M501DRAFT_989377 [Patellaria atrata CBS 101060]